MTQGEGCGGEGVWRTDLCDGCGEVLDLAFFLGAVSKTGKNMLRVQPVEGRDWGHVSRALGEGK